MRQDDRTGADQLNIAWDSVLAGRPNPFHGLDSDLADRIRTIHSLAAPPPNSSFNARLDTSLRRAQELKHLSDTSQPPAAPLDQSLPLRTVPIARAMAAAVVLLATIVGVVTLAIGDDRDEPRTVQLAAATAATPSTIAITVGAPSLDSESDSPIRFSECDVTPPAAADVEDASPSVRTDLDSTIDARLGGSSDYSKPRVVMGLPNGPEASATQLAGIEATLRKLSACRFYNTAEAGPNGRLFSLFTESFRANLTIMPGGQVEFPWLPNPNEPASVQLTRQLPNGRVLAVLLNEMSFAPGNYQVLLVAFAASGQQWLLDEVLDVTSWELADAQWEQDRGILELVLTEQAPGYRPVNGSPVLIDGWSYTLVLYNPGATERGFRSEGLGIDVTVPPYETRTVVFTPTEGEYSFETRTGDEVDEVAPPPCEGMPYPGNIMIVFSELPLNDPWSCGKG